MNDLFNTIGELKTIYNRLSAYKYLTDTKTGQK